MAYVRFASRYVQESLVGVVKTFLQDYGWFGPTVPFGAQAVTPVLREPKTSELAPIQGNTVFISFGPEGDHRVTQLGGGQLSLEHILFVDVVGENPTIANAIAADIKDRLTGLFGGTRYVRPVDPTTGHELPGYIGEFIDVVREQPNGENPNWHSIKATFVLEFPGEES